MSPAAPVAHFEYKLWASKRAHKYGHSTSVRDEERYAKLSDQPPGLPDIRGSHALVSSYACKLNESQINSGFLDYLYYPEIVGAPEAPKTPGADDIAPLLQG